MYLNIYIAMCLGLKCLNLNGLRNILIGLRNGKLF